jgi:DNA-binding NarL/FixJ family response regulator
MGIRLLIADGHSVFRDAISLWLDRHEGFEVLTPAEDGCSAVALARQLRPDIVLMDAVMPRLNGFDATRQIANERPESKVIIFSEVVDSQSVCSALEAGAVGYLSKYCSSDELVRAIHDVVSEGTYLCPAASTVVVQQLLCECDSPVRSGKTSLTPRQRQIVQQVAEGQSIKKIARDLGLSPKTVDWHKAQVMKKLGIDCTAGLVRYAMVEGLTFDGLLPAGVD